MDTDLGVLLTEQLGPVRLLTINRPHRLNALNPGVVLALNEALDAAAGDDATRALVITGAGSKAFVAGNEVDGLARLDGVGAYRDMMAGQRSFLRLHEFAKPTLAMVNGYALGGGLELALACDFIVAADSARFGFPEITLNTMPGWGGTQLAVKKMGLARAKQMVLTGHHFTVDECLHFGFIHQVAAADKLRAATLEFAARLTRHTPFAMEMAKRSVNRAGELPLSAGMEFEAANYAVNFGTAEARAGLHAFLARREEKQHHRTAGSHTTIEVTT
jgi:enoyl-CoA hydratase/carnithine racemase